MAENRVQRVHTESIVMDIGDDRGGLIIYTPPDLLGAEIEVAPAAYPDFKSHTDVAERLVNGRSLFAGVFTPLLVGEYLVCRPVEHAGQPFRVESGRVTELHWRDPADT